MVFWISIKWCMDKWDAEKDCSAKKKSNNGDKKLFFIILVLDSFEFNLLSF